MSREDKRNMDGFELGRPALVCRWRLSHGTLPLENRHMRALLARTVNGERVSTQLVAWAKQHIEWTLADGSAQDPNGVLMLIIDDRGRAAMTVGPYAPLKKTSVRSLAIRALRAADEGSVTGVAPEVLWGVRGEDLLWDCDEDYSASAASSLVIQLAQTLGLPVRRRPDLARDLLEGAVSLDEAFLASDEHGIVVADDASGSHGTRFAAGYRRLLERA